MLQIVCGSEPKATPQLLTRNDTDASCFVFVRKETNSISLHNQVAKPLASKELVLSFVWNVFFKCTAKVSS